MSKLLVGQVDPVDQKSSSIQITALETIDPNWKRIDLLENSLNANEMPDRSWQSVKTAAVISLNSACRQVSEMGLKEITTDLLSQWRDLNDKIEKDFSISGFPALETTAEGIYYNRKRKLQIVVVKTPTCVYDLMFLSPVKSYAQDLVTFQKFRDKLIIK